MNLKTLTRAGAITVLVGMLVAVGCQQGNQTTTTGPAGKTDAQATAPAEKGKLPDASKRQIPPDFTLTSIDGKQFTLSEMQGKSPVLINFFSTT